MFLKKNELKTKVDDISFLSDFILSFSWCSSLSAALWAPLNCFVDGYEVGSAC